MIAGDAECITPIDHVHRQTQYVRNSWTAIDKISQEDHLATFRMLRLNFRDLVAELAEKQMEFVKTTVDVADDVEWPMLMFEIVPERLPLDDDCVNLFRC